MIIEVRAKPSSRKPKVEALGNNKYIISVSEPAKDGKANTAVERALADYLNIPRARILLKHGASSRDKVFEID